MTLHRLNRFGKFLDNLSPLFKLMISKIIFDIVLIALLWVVDKSDLIKYVMGLNGILIFTYMVSTGELELSIKDWFKFIIRKKE